MIRRVLRLHRNTGPTGPEACEHSATELLGFNRGVSFLRCKACAYVLVAQGERAWAIQPARSSI